MVKLAVLHPTLPLYMRQSEQEDGRHLQVVFSEAELDAFNRGIGNADPDVLVVDLALLGPDPETVLARLEERTRPEMTVVVYAFAKWNQVEALRGSKRAVLRAPISVRALRSNLVNLIVRQLAAGRGGGSGGGTGLPTTAPPPRRYDDVQLAGLQEIRAKVDCECPNQVADIVLALAAFEQYSLACQNRNEADAKVHAMLARSTGHARSMMELALEELCRFEGIDINRLPRRQGVG